MKLRYIGDFNRQNMSVDEEVEETTGTKTLLQQQLEKSSEILYKLMVDSMESITNVRVANDSREVDRREEEGIKREKIMEQLEAEAELSKEMFLGIAEKWSRILKHNDPLQINDAMKEQRERCEELIRQKDAIVEMLKMEVDEAGKKFTNDQYKQNEDIATLTKRIEKQVRDVE